MPGLNYPLARHADLVIQPLAEETIIYDKRDDSTFALNLTTTRVWKLCDGAHTPLDMARVLSAEFGTTVSQDVVRYALAKLETAHLLEAPLQTAAGTARLSRRDFLKSAGVTALVALPVVMRVHAPSPNQAGSCGGFCDIPADCSPGCGCNIPVHQCETGT